MHKADQHRAHGCLRVIGLEQTEKHCPIHLLVFLRNVRSERRHTYTDFVENKRPKIIQVLMTTPTHITQDNKH